MKLHFVFLMISFFSVNIKEKHFKIFNVIFALCINKKLLIITVLFKIEITVIHVYFILFFFLNLILYSMHTSTINTFSKIYDKSYLLFFLFINKKYN